MKKLLFLLAFCAIFTLSSCDGYRTSRVDCKNCTDKDIVVKFDDEVYFDLKSGKSKHKNIGKEDFHRPIRISAYNGDNLMCYKSGVQFGGTKNYEIDIFSEEVSVTIYYK